MSKLDNAIATLNALDVGSLEKISEQLLAVREELVRHELDELVAKVDACRASLESGEIEDFRRQRETIVSRLGHLRVKMQ